MTNQRKSKFFDGLIMTRLYRTKLTRKFIMVIVSGDKEVNQEIIEKYFGEEIVETNNILADSILFSIRDISFAGFMTSLETVIDSDILQHEYLWSYTSVGHRVIELRTRDLLNQTNGKTISIK